MVEAYIAGLEARASKGLPLDQVASVASFFLSRIDVLVDPMLDKIVRAAGPEAATAARLQGQVAIASAKVAYQIYHELFGGERFKRLASQGARPQRLLWASTSTKNPAYSDIKYVEALIGANTINTVPLETLDAYRDHGHPEQTLERGSAAAQQALHDLATLGIDLDRVTQQLEDDGVAAFVSAFDRLMVALEEKQAAGQAAGT
jgi:transaldolase